jgi:hypothetical protein
MENNIQKSILVEKNIHKRRFSGKFSPILIGNSLYNGKRFAHSFTRSNICQQRSGCQQTIKQT